MGGNIIWMECECPYAQDEKACKHMAAVTKMVMKSDEETVRNYLVSVLMESDNYLLRFKMITDVCSQGDVPVVYGTVKKSREASECKAFCREHWQNTATRMYYIGLCEEEGAYEETLQALDESIAIDRSLSKLQIRDYEKQKKEIYRVIKDEEHYREQLWKLVEDYSPIDIELYRELRGLYDEKSWSELRERIISSVRDIQSRNELLEEEKLYDRLLDSVLQSPGLYTLRQYDDVLGELYPVQILEKYRQQLNQMAEMMLVAAAGIVFCGRKLYKSR